MLLRPRLATRLLQTLSSAAPLAAARPAARAAHLQHSRVLRQSLPTIAFSTLRTTHRTSDTPDYSSLLSPALLRAVLAGGTHSSATPVTTFEDTYIFGPPAMSSPPRTASTHLQHIDTQTPDLPAPFIDQPIPTPTTPASPSSVLLPAPLFTVKSLPPLSLMELVHRLTSELASPHLDLDAVHSLMAAYDASLNEWQRFAFWDESKRYTRNLIATDYSSFTLMLLCWNAQQGSPVHDHASSECFMRVVHGSVAETQYDRIDTTAASHSAPSSPPHDSITSATAATSLSSPASSSPSSAALSAPSHGHGPLRVRREHTVGAGSVLFINDSIGLHKIDNPFPQRAVTLHLYIPPYESCHCYSEADGAVKESYVHFHSENGELVADH